MLSITQLKNRKKGIGGSDVASIFGLSKWKSAHDVFVDKTTDDVENKEPTESQIWGNKKEPILIERYEEVYGCSVNSLPHVEDFVTNGFHIMDSSLNTIASSEYPFMIANIDGWIPSERAVLELKTYMTKDGWGEPETDQIPTQYLLQVAHYCIVTNADIGYIYVEMEKRHPVRYVYHRNKELEQAIIEKEKHFWEEHVLKGIAPELQTIDDVMNFYGVVDDPIEGDNNQACLVNELKSLKSTIKDLEKMEGDVKKELLESLKGHNVLTFQGKTLLTWKEQVSKRLDATAIKKEMPEVYSQFLKESKSRVLRLKGD